MPPSERPEACPDAANAPRGGPRGPSNISFSCRNLPSTRQRRNPVAVVVVADPVFTTRGTGSSASSLVRCSIKSIFSRYRRVCHVPKYNVPAHRLPKKIFPDRFNPPTTARLLLLFLILLLAIDVIPMKSRAVDGNNMKCI